MFSSALESQHQDNIIEFRRIDSATLKHFTTVNNTLDNLKIFLVNPAPKESYFEKKNCEVLYIAKV